MNDFSTYLTNIGNTLGNVLKNTSTYTRQPLPQDIVSAYNTSGQNVSTLRSGAQATAPTPELSSALQDAYSNNPSIPAGHLEALTMQESSMGYNKSGYNASNGKFGYVFGLSAPAFKDVGASPKDANTLTGAANVAAKYYAKYYKSTNDPATQYKQYYNRNPAAPFNPAQYNSQVSFYAPLSPQKGIANK